VLALAIATAACQPRDPLTRARWLQEQKGDFAASLEPLHDVLREHPEDPEANFRYGLALIESGQLSLAKWSLRKAMESPEWVEQAGIPLATTAIKLNGFDEAAEVASRVLAAKPDHIEALLLRADAYVRSRRHYEEALADAERAIALDPERIDAQVPKVVSLLGLGRADEAAAALEKLESSYSDGALGLHGSPALCAARGTFAKEKGENEKATELFEKCLAQLPSDALVVREAVSFFDGIDRGDRSEEVLRRALEDDPDSFGYRATLIDRMRAAGRQSEAEALLRAATELENPASAAVGWSALALYSLETGRFDEAAAAFERAVAHDPTGSAEIRFGYADALVVVGRYEEALRLADQMTVPAHRSLVRGRVALARGEPAKALEYFTEGNRLWPNNPVSRYYAAAASEQIGAFERAIEEYRYSMRIDPRATDAYLRLARLFAASGQIPSALQTLSFQPGGRPGEEEATLLELELRGRTERVVSRTLLARLAPARRGAAAAALARGIAVARGPAAAIEFLRIQDDLDLRDPKHAEALSELIDALAASGKASDGLARVDAALRAHPDAAVFHALRGKALLAAGRDPSLARAAYQRALEIDSEQHRALAGLAELEAKAGATESALALYERAARADAKDRDSIRAVAALLVQTGRPEEADSRLTGLLRDHPYDAQAAIALAELRRARGADPAATAELARRAVKFKGGPAAKALLDRIEAERSAAQAQAPARTG